MLFSRRAHRRCENNPIGSRLKRDWLGNRSFNSASKYFDRLQNRDLAYILSLFVVQSSDHEYGAGKTTPTATGKKEARSRDS
jgi:hypothetical protein